MSNISMLHMKLRFVSIHADKAMLCRACRFVSNSEEDRCGLCDSDLLISVSALAGAPPTDPDPGPSPAAAVVHFWPLAEARAA